LCHKLGDFSVILDQENVKRHGTLGIVIWA